MDRVFLDANVLFSAAWLERSGLPRLWELPGTVLLTSEYAREEARVNLPADVRRERLRERMRAVTLVPEAYDRPLPEDVLLPARDRPILLAALAAGATHLVTGDRRDFGPLYGREIEGLRVRSPGEYLRSR